jgi:hypothetical protein
MCKIEEREAKKIGQKVGINYSNAINEKNMFSVCFHSTLFRYEKQNSKPKHLKSVSVF